MHSTRTSSASLQTAKEVKETNIQVVVRIRPRSPKEIRENSSVAITTPSVRSKEIIVGSGTTEKRYTFDRVFGPEAKQVTLFNDIVQPMLQQVLQGYSSTLFAYGNTGTGKTYTMQGDHLDPTHEDAGLIPRAMESLFQHLSDLPEATVKVSMLELYNEELQDLLAPVDAKKLRLVEDVSGKSQGVVVHGLEEVHVYSTQDVLNVLNRGAMKRQTAGTQLNDKSSRSHVIFSATINVKEVTQDGEEMWLTGKLNMVDLAGSENIGRSGAQGKTARESGLINQSLLTLGRCINALVDRSSHIPYRESKLTRLLQDSLGGRTKTCILATLSPARVALDESISTLEYANRAKRITNKPQVNLRVEKQEFIQDYSREIRRLHADLQATREKNGIYLSQEHYNELVAEKEGRGLRVEELTRVKEELEEMLKSLTEQVNVERNGRIMAERELNSTRGKLEQTCERLELTRQRFAVTLKDLKETTKTCLTVASSERNLNVLATGMNILLSKAEADLNRVWNRLESKTEKHLQNHQLCQDLSVKVSSQIQALDGTTQGWNGEVNGLFSKLLTQLRQWAEVQGSSISNTSMQISHSARQCQQQIHQVANDVLAQFNQTKNSWTQMSNSTQQLLRHGQEGMSEHLQQWEKCLNDWKQVLQDSQSSTSLLFSQLTHDVTTLTSQVEGFIGQNERKTFEMMKSAHTAIQQEIGKLTQRNQQLESMVESFTSTTHTKQSELLSQIGQLVNKYTEETCLANVNQVHHEAWSQSQATEQALKQVLDKNAQTLTQVNAHSKEFKQEFGKSSESLQRKILSDSERVKESLSTTSLEQAKKVKIQITSQTKGLLDSIADAAVNLSEKSDEGASEVKAMATQSKEILEGLIQAIGVLEQGITSSMQSFANAEVTRSRSVEEGVQQAKNIDEEFKQRQEQLVGYVGHTLKEGFKKMQWDLEQDGDRHRLTWPKSWTLSGNMDEEAAKSVPFTVRDFFIHGPGDNARHLDPMDHVSDNVDLEPLIMKLEKLRGVVVESPKVSTPKQVASLMDSPMPRELPISSPVAPLVTPLEKSTLSTLPRLGSRLAKPVIKRQGSSNMTLMNE